MNTTISTIQVGQIVSDEDGLPGRVMEVDESNEEVLVLWRDGPSEAQWEKFDDVQWTDLPSCVSWEELDRFEDPYLMWWREA